MKNTTTSVYTFEKLIDGNYLYVDKTEHIYNLVREPYGIYFMSRPRRFGKSLMLSTLKSVFEGRRELFKGLYIDSADYNWNTHPVIHIELGANKMSSALELEQFLLDLVSDAAQFHNITLTKISYEARFKELIETLGKDTKVVILIDEYDKPILNNVDKPEVCAEILESLKGFYSVIKGTEAYQRFVILTGVSKFSRVSVFSDLNNLEDLTMSKKYATMFGYTQGELEQNFDEKIEEIAAETKEEKTELLSTIKEWYNGYKFEEGSQTVYNPVSVMKFFENKKFSNYWFETGTPSFLIKLMKEKEFDLNILESNEISEMSFASYEINRLEVLPLLFQTGYVTIKEFFIDGNFRFYKLGFPNREVECAFSTYIADYFCNVKKELVDSYIYRSLKALRDNNIDALFEQLKIFFANVDYTITLKHEKYYQTIFYVYFTLIGANIHAEVVTNNGRIDAVIEAENRLYIFEFKLQGTAEDAMAQIKDMKYFQKYQNGSKPITLIGCAFDQTTRNIESWLTEEL